ncbi:hypothetical protein H4R23_003745 [Coemansia sp. Cherry 401B]|nr:hypothetical protein H4R23_003745 [Coemansia sp. Cherry 401B]
MQSPTVPSNLFGVESPPVTGLAPSLEQTLSTLAANLDPPQRGHYTLNPAFMRAWEENNPPVPQLPKIPGGSVPVRIKAPVPTEKPISFPRPSDEPQRIRPATAAPAPAEALPSLPPPPVPAPRLPLPPQQPPQTKPSASLEQTARMVSRGFSIRQQPMLYPKRNYSLPAALAPPAPTLKLENYEFTSIESLERKWADAKTETTRMLSSAIYKYYFSHGAWHDFEQVFPGKVLEAWEDFHNKLTASELGFVNAVLVSQNPFSSEQGSQEKHIPVLARTIPLSQVVRTMVFSEDMRSRESFGSQGSSGTEIDSEFADWLISRFNTKRPGTATSPFVPTATEPQKAIEEVPQPKQSEAPSQPESELPPARPEAPTQPALSERRTPSPPPPAPTKPAEQEKAPKPAEPVPEVPEPPAQPEPAAPEMTQPAAEPQLAKVPAHKSLGLWSSKSISRRPKTASNLETHGSTDELPKTRRKNTIGGAGDEPPVPKSSLRRPTINLPSVFQSWRKGSSKTDATALDEMLNLPASPKKERPSTAARPTSSKSRRHTHNFFSSSSTSSMAEPRPSLDSTRSTRRATREIQMKDLPPLPPNAAEISQLGRLGAEAKIKVSHSASVLRKGSNMLTHFSSHSELGQRMAAAFDKPRSSSLTAENNEKSRRRPSIAAPSLVESTSTKSSRSRESSSTEIIPMVYDWRPAPLHGDCSWGFSISPLALQRPLGRKKSNAMLVVNSHTPTMNRRVLPNPQTPEEASKPPKRSASKSTKLTASRSMPESRPESKRLSIEKEKQPVPPELPKAKMPQSQLGLGVSAGAKSGSNAPNTAMSGVRGVLYELAYLSTQGKNVWSKSDHIFANMAKTGLEVNRIAEQDFFDFCVDELLKASNEASQDLQAMGNKKVAKKLYESFNAKLAILLADSAL